MVVVSAMSAALWFAVWASIGKASDWRGTLALLRSMDQERLPLDTIAANSALGAFARCARWPEALALVHDMGVRRVCRIAVIVVGPRQWRSLVPTVA